MDGQFTIDPRPLSTWTSSTGGLWSDPSYWDAIPLGSNVIAVEIPAINGKVVFDSSAASTQLQALNLSGALQLSGGLLSVGTTTVAPTGQLEVPAAGVFSTSQLVNQGLVSLQNGASFDSLIMRAGQLAGSGSLLVSANVSLAGGIVSGFSGFDFRQSSSDLIIQNTSIQSAGAVFSAQASQGSVMLDQVSIDLSGATTGGYAALDGNRLDIRNSFISTSGSSDGGVIALGKRQSLPASVNIADSRLTADPPSQGGVIQIDGGLIAISGTSALNIYGSSGGSLQIGSTNTASLQLAGSVQILSGPTASLVYLTAPVATTSTSASSPSITSADYTVQPALSTSTFTTLAIQPLITSPVISSAFNQQPVLSTQTVTTQNTTTETATTPSVSSSTLSTATTSSSTPLTAFDATLRIGLDSSDFAFQEPSLTAIAPSSTNAGTSPLVSSPSAPTNQSTSTTDSAAGQGSVAPVAGNSESDANSTASKTTTQPQSKSEGSSGKDAKETDSNSQEKQSGSEKSTQKGKKQEDPKSGPSGSSSTDSSPSAPVQPAVQSMSTADARQSYQGSEERALKDTASRLGLAGAGSATAPSIDQIQNLLQSIQSLIRRP